MPTIPGWTAPKNKGRPWWAAALVGGFGAVLAVLFGLGLIGAPARGSEIRPSAASIADDHESRMARIEGKLDEMARQLTDQGQRLARIEGRLDRK